MTDGLQLADEFRTVTREQWLRAVRGVVLKGRPDASDEDFASAFAAQLVTRTEDGFDLQPLYDADDAPAPSGWPGFAPFVRSSHPAAVPWEIRQRVWPGVDGSSAVTELESGATGVLLELPGAADAALLDRVLDGVLLELAPVSLATPAADDGVAAARLLVAGWDRAGVDAGARRGTLGVDPLGTWARTGGASVLATGFAAAAELVTELTTTAPAARVVVIDGTVWHEAGASAGQELAWTAAAGAATVRALVDAGVRLAPACAQLEFRFAATADQFAAIAKLRAARRVWARVTELAGLPPEARSMFQHVVGSHSMLTRYDTWVNALRSTVACFAAGTGGADAVTINPHDVLRVEGGTSLGRRVARNTQSVLQYESNLSRVVDPAGGSFYVESRTEDLAGAAWAELQRVEAAGGIADALTSGLVATALHETRTARTKRLATRRRPLTGVSEFPNIDEEPPPPLDTTPTVEVIGTPFTPLSPHRLAADFERQRGRADAHAAVTGTRPSVYLATLGAPAASTARATFAKNLFEAGGIRAVPGPPAGFTPSMSTLACLCSSDAVYAEQGQAAVQSLRHAGATRIYVAGRNVELTGVDEEVGIGTDALDVLTRALDELGVAR